MGRDEIPPGYVEGVQKLASVLRAGVARGLRPVFRSPSKDIMVIGTLEGVGKRFACNDDARALLKEMLEAPIEGGGTVFMMRVALDLAGVKVLPCTLKDLGITPTGVMARGGKA